MMRRQPKANRMLTLCANYNMSPTSVVKNKKSSSAFAYISNSKSFNIKYCLNPLSEQFVWDLVLNLSD